MNNDACGKEDYCQNINPYSQSIGSFCRCDHCGADAYQLTYIPTGTEQNGCLIYSKLCPQCYVAWNLKNQKDVHIHIHIYQPYPFSYPVIPTIQPWWGPPTIVPSRPNPHGGMPWWGETWCGDVPSGESWSGPPMLNVPSYN
jgi:hypothetical protein